MGKVNGNWRKGEEGKGRDSQTIGPTMYISRAMKIVIALEKATVMIWLLGKTFELNVNNPQQIT